MATSCQDGMTQPLPLLFRYYGSKTSMVSTITSLVPQGAEVLISLFMGSGVFEYNYAAAHPQCKVVCYDIDPSLVNFHQQALLDRAALHSTIIAMHTKLCGGKPFLSFECVKHLAAHVAGPRGNRGGGMAAAARFYIVTAYSFNGKFGSYAAKPFRYPNGLLHALPQNMEVRQGDAMHVLKAVKAGKHKLCLYLDPPYMFPYLSKDYYSTSKTTFDRQGMATLLHDLNNEVPWVLSYNDTPDVRKMYSDSDWSKLSLPTTYSYYNREKNKAMHHNSVVHKAELLITNWRLPMAQRRHTRAVFSGRVVRFSHDSPRTLRIL